MARLPWKQVTASWFYLERNGEDNDPNSRFSHGVQLVYHHHRSSTANECVFATLLLQVVGLSVSQTIEDLALLYLSTIQALAVSFPLSTLQADFLSASVSAPWPLCLLCRFFWFQLGTRHILEAMKEAGHDIRTIFLCGGLSKNALFVQIHANATGISIIYTESYGDILHIPVMSASTPRFTCGFTRSNGGGVDRSGNFGSLCFSGLRFCTGTTSAYTHTHDRVLCSWLMFSFLPSVLFC